MAGYDRWRGPDAAQFLVGIHDGEELFVVWCKKEQDSLYNEIERLESGRLQLIRTGHLKFGANRILAQHARHRLRGIWLTKLIEKATSCQLLRQ
jgi:hypothetical protein